MRDIEIKLLPHQLELLNATESVAGMVAGRGSGKTYIASVIAAHSLLSGKRIIVFAQDFRALTLNLLTNIRQLLDDWQVDYEYNRASQTISCGDGFLIGFSYQNMESVRGATEISLALFDEIALAPSNLLEVVSPCMRGKGIVPKLRFFTTPRGGTIWNKKFKDNPDWKLIKATTFDNKYVGKESIELLQKAYSDENLRRQELLGEILEDVVANCIISNEDFASDCVNSDDRRFVCGIDFARYGNDSTAIVIRNSNRIITTKLLHHADTQLICSEYRTLMNVYPCESTYLDATGGFDIGFYDTLKNEYNLKEVNFGGASNSVDCANARSSMYFELAKAIKDGFYISDENIKEALRATAYTINTSGKKALLPKESIKAIIGRSPDETDALALTFFDGLKPSVSRLTKDRQNDFINFLFRT